MAKLCKNDLVNLIYVKLNKSLTKVAINDAIIVIIDFIVETLQSGKVFSVTNFGTFYPYFVLGQFRFNFATKKVNFGRNYKTIKFRPHSNFVWYLKWRRSKLLRSQVKTSTSRAT